MACYSAMARVARGFMLRGRQATPKGWHQEKPCLGPMLVVLFVGAGTQPAREEVGVAEGPRLKVVGGTARAEGLCHCIECSPHTEEEGDAMSSNSLEENALAVLTETVKNEKALRIVVDQLTRELASCATKAGVLERNVGELQAAITELNTENARLRDKLEAMKHLSTLHTELEKFFKGDQNA